MANKEEEESVEPGKKVMLQRELFITDPTA